MRSFLLLLGAATAGVLAIPTTDHVVHERRDFLPSHWTEEGRLDGEAVLPVRIGLTQSNMDSGHDMLMDLSNPNSDKYGQHLSAEDVYDLFAPSQDSVDTVRNWIESSGIHPERVSHSTNKQWLQFDATASEVEDLLRTEYYLYNHAGTGRSHIACREYHVPKSVQDHVDFVKPGISLMEVRGAQHARRDTPQNLQKRQLGILPPIMRPLTEPLEAILGDFLGFCSVAVTPKCIKAMYNVTDGSKKAKGNELGIFEGLGDVYAQEDLDMFFSTVAHEIPEGTHPVHHLINGAKAPADLVEAGPESDLDFQVSYPLIWPQNSVLFQTDDPVYQENYNFTGFLNNFLDAIDGSYCSEDEPHDPPYPNPAKGGYKGQKQCGVYKPTNVISISYGAAEADLPIKYQRRQCQEWMKLGLQGVSVVVASGDSGVMGRGGSPRPSNCLGEDDKVFAPDFPATCPYVTATGGTVLPPFGDAEGHEEVATSSFASGGGFSNIYKRADWQNDAVEKYFETADPGYKHYSGVDNSSFAEGGGIYNRIGRAYPDVAAIADNVLVFNKLIPQLVSGTSAAAPVFAALLTLINEERIAAGRPTVGFVNPMIYAHPEAFNDVTEGNNEGCGTDGFKAAKGWDPVTGMGTPDYQKLLDVFMKE